MTGSLRERILSKGKVPSALVTVMGDDKQPMEVLVRGLTQGARGRLLTASTRVEVGDDGEKKTTVDMAVMQPQLIIECACDPASEAPLFQQTDLDAINGLHAAFLDPIIEKASELSGLTTPDLENVAGNS